mgnify:CR=1 FL=1
MKFFIAIFATLGLALAAAAQTPTPTPTCPDTHVPCGGACCAK